MARMLAPENTISASFAGENIPVGEDGFADVPDAAVAVLKDFGFVLESEIPTPVAVDETVLTPQQKAAATKAAKAAAAKAAETTTTEPPAA